MTERDFTSHHRAVVGCIREYVRQHGKKRGIQLAAASIGIGERAARHAYDGGPFAADEARAARADAARVALLNDTIAQLCAVRDQIERERHVETAGQRVDNAFAVLLAKGRRVFRENEECQKMNGRAA